MFNKIILAGHLSKDIEIRYTQGGAAIANTGIASSRKYKGADGQPKEEVLFVDLTFYGRTAEVANQYLRKGSKVLIDGRLKLDQWTDGNGQKRSRHKVDVLTLTMLGDKDNRQTGTPPPKQSPVPPQQSPAPQPTHQPAATQQPHPPHTSPPFPDMELNDEIPF